MSGTFIETFWRDIIARYPTWMLDTVGMLIWHEAIYFGAAIPFILMDCIPALHKYKIQKDNVNTLSRYVKVVGHVLFSHVMQMMLMAIFHFIAPLCGVRYDGNLESVWSIARLVVVSFFIEDFWFYWLHRLLHHGMWYKYIHKMHHEYQAPNSLSGEYAHPAETLILGVGTIIGPLCMATHITSVYIWIGIRLLQVVECHSGYDFPWSPRKFIPFWGGAEFHDFHHETFTGNYASTFTIWDHVFGTDAKYRDRKVARLKAAEKEAKVASKQA